MGSNDDFIKIGDNQTITVTPQFDEPTLPQGQYNTLYWKCNEGTLTPTQSLAAKMKDAGIKKGVKCKITKVKNEELNDGYPFFEVERLGAHTHGTEDPVDPKPPVAKKEPSVASTNPLYDAIMSELSDLRSLVEDIKTEVTKPPPEDDEDDDDLPF